MELTDKFFSDSVNQFKSDLKENRDTFITSHEIYCKSTSYYDPISGRGRRETELKYFLWYIKDQGYDYTIHEETKEIYDKMEGWCTQLIRLITIKLK